jgi:hypothetical protein
MPIQSADPALRRRATLLLGAAAVVLIGFFAAARYWLVHASAGMSTAQLVSTVQRVLAVCIALMVLCLLALGRHLLLRGRRIVRDRRYPAHDARTLRDTPISEGDAAVRIGNTSRLAGLAGCLLAIALAIAGWFWVAQLG